MFNLPMEFTTTALYSSLASRRVATVATQQLAAVDALTFLQRKRKRFQLFYYINNMSLITLNHWDF